jgi:hypothetical protein
MGAVHTRLDARSAQRDVVQAYNRLVDRDAGNGGDAARAATQIRWTQFDGSIPSVNGSVAKTNQPTLLLRQKGGIHRRTLLSTTDPDGTLDASNCVELVDDAGLFVGAGKPIRLYDVAGVDYAQLTSDADGGLVLAGSGANAGLLTVAKLVAPTIGPNVVQQHAVPAVAPDTLALLTATQTLTNKTLTAPVIATIVNTGTLTLPTSTDTLVGRATADTLTNKTITSPTMAGTWQAPAVDPPTVDGQVVRGALVKAFAFVIGGGGATLGDNFNVATVTRNAAGDFTIAWDRDFGGALYACLVTIDDSASTLIAKVNSKVGASADIWTMTPAGVKTDPIAFAVVALGTLV